ncbi:MAG: HNH endonuclease, partial [Deltaproteobacteria bacterium]|nr:HNH endonuclease [Deltaproteobacteria bacterium]
ASIIKKLKRLAPISGVVFEDCKFDTQLMMDPSISGVGYQRGSLYGYNVKEWLLENRGRQCVYCGAKNVPLEVEHVVPKAKEGTNRLSNLTIACHKCNQAKGAQDVKEFLANDPKRLATVLANLKKSLKGAAAMNSVRYALKERLMGLGLPVYSASAAETKYNRSRFDIVKSHVTDAAAIGKLSKLTMVRLMIVVITAFGHGQRRRQRSDKHGFPRKGYGVFPKHKMIQGFITGDLVKATVTRGPNQGTHVGRVTVRSTGQFYIKRPGGKIIYFSAKNAKLLQRGDGYAYSLSVPSEIVTKKDL